MDGARGGGVAIGPRWASWIMGVAYPDQYPQLHTTGPKIAQRVSGCKILPHFRAGSTPIYSPKDTFCTSSAYWLAESASPG